MSYMNFGIWTPKGDTNKEKLEDLTNNMFCKREQKDVIGEIYELCPKQWDNFEGAFYKIKCEVPVTKKQLEREENQVKKAWVNDTVVENNNWLIGICKNYAKIVYKKSI